MLHRNGVSAGTYFQSRITHSFDRFGDLHAAFGVLLLRLKRILVLSDHCNRDRRQIGSNMNRRGTIDRDYPRGLTRSWRCGELSLCDGKNRKQSGNNEDEWSVHIGSVFDWFRNRGAGDAHEASSVAPRLEGAGSLGKHAEELMRRTGGPGGVAAAGLV